MRTRPFGSAGTAALDTNTCSWSDASHDEHTFEVADGRDEPVTASTMPVVDRPDRRSSRHTTYRRAETHRRREHTSYQRVEPGSFVFRPGGPVEGRKFSGTGPHRMRATHIRCDDPRTVARAAALRRRHVLLAVLAVAILLVLAGPLAGRGSDTASRGAPVGSTLSPHSLYVVQPGDTLWSIAQRLDPQTDPRPAVAAMSAEIGSATVRPGERLTLP
jgi:hypothetical protein